MKRRAANTGAARTPRARRGSALLVVLGMLAFIIVSAVGFSVFMRNSRLPSSFLRRSSATRLLAKAALARAIDFTDRSIGNNPHPGVSRNSNAIGTRFDHSDEGLYANGEFFNTWFDRVLFGQKDSDFNTTVANIRGTGVNPSEKPSVLNLEALAYIPPALVNAARVLSHATPTADWKILPFETGRYNFLVLDVSDCLDINRLQANMRRSSAPNGRISLSYMFEPFNHNGPGTGMDQWDSFMAQFRDFDRDSYAISFNGKYPLISLADWNLAMGKSSFGGVKSTFCDVIGTTRNTYDNGTGDAYWDALALQTFVTDSWATNGFDAVQNDAQPFESRHLLTEENGHGVPDPGRFLAGSIIGNCQNELWPEMLSKAGCANLFDYLDTDRVPTFLALPCAERTPMIAAVEPFFPMEQISIKTKYEQDGDKSETPQEKNYDETEAAAKGYKAEGVAYFMLDGLKDAFQNGRVRVLSVFPFARSEEDDDQYNYSIDGRFSLFLSSEAMGLRTGARNDALHLKSKQIESAPTKPDPESGLMSVVFQERPVDKFNPSGEDEGNDIFRVNEFQLRDGRAVADSLTSDSGENAILKVTYRWTLQKTGTQSTGGVITSTYGPTFKEVVEDPAKADLGMEGQCLIPVVGRNGTASTISISKEQLTGSGAPELRLNAAVWLRIKERNSGEIVDMVPACLGDDGVARNAPDLADIALNYRKYGAPWPLMRFDVQLAGNDKIILSIDNQSPDNVKNLGVKTGNLSPAAVAVRDPRFNFAPEFWGACGQLTADPNTAKQAWLAAAGKTERDIYMATSDAGYLQSIYELAFLPRLTPLADGGNTSFGTDDRVGDMGDILASTDPRSLAGAPPDYGFMREYNPHTDNSDFERFRTIERIAKEDVGFSTDAGFKINPLGGSSNILAAAFANTPAGWRFASTNTQTAAAARFAAMDARQFNENCAFNEYSGICRFYWEDMMKFAGEFATKTKEYAMSGDWEKIWSADSGLWGGDTDSLGNVKLDSSDPLFPVDKKFLYGFWRDCFAVRQQLFLMFVRAEPIMAVAGDPNQIPPQQTARAVALVWRNPLQLDPNDKTDETNTDPHGTRVLFYRQFD